MVIASRVGGVSGAIWGTAFLRAGVAAGDKQELTPDDVIAMLGSAIEGMKKRGQSDLGDKTLLDAYVPADGRARESAARGRQRAGRPSGAPARWRAQKTEEIKPWVAKRGRACVYGRAKSRYLRCRLGRRRGHGGTTGRSLGTGIDRLSRGSVR